MNNIDDSAAKLADVIKKSKHIGKIKAYTGKIENGKTIADLDNLPPNQIWVRLRKKSATPTNAFNFSVNPQATDIAVWVEKDNEGKLEVLGLVNQESSDTLGPLAQTIAANSSPSVSFVKRSQIKELKPGVSGLTITVAPYSDVKGSFKGGSIAATPPTSVVDTESFNYEILYFDINKGKLEFTDNDNTTFVSRNAKPSDIYDVRYNRPPSNSIPICLVRLQVGATSLSNSDIIDIRQTFTSYDNTKITSVYIPGNLQNSGELPFRLYNHSGSDRTIVSIGLSFFNAPTGSKLWITPQLSTGDIFTYPFTRTYQNAMDIDIGDTHAAAGLGAINGTNGLLAFINDLWVENSWVKLIVNGGDSGNTASDLVLTVTYI